MARLVPPAEQIHGIPPRFLELAERGVLKLPERQPTAGADDDLPPPVSLKKGASVLEALLEERRTGR